jgi:hypothetical protein
LAQILERCLAKDPERRPSAAFLAKAFAGEGEARSQGQGSPRFAENGNVVESLLKRRLPQTVVVTGGIGLAALGFVGLLADVIDRPIFQAALATFIGSLLASSVVAWFHGEKGPQKVTALEVVLLAALTIIWIAVLVAIFL